MTFHIIIAGIYPSTEAFESVVVQNTSHPKRIWCVQDLAPESETIHELGRDRREHVIRWHRKEQNYISKNHWELFKHFINPIAEPEDVLVFVDGDDKLIGRNAFGPAEAAYRKNPVLLMTYGSYRYRSNGKRGSFSGPYRTTKPIRMSQWHGTHLKTIKVKLWRHLTEDVFKDKDGNWLRMSSDVAWMLACLDMAGHDRAKYLHQVVYEYNDQNLLNDHKIDGRLQIETDKWLRSLLPRERLVEV